MIRFRINAEAPERVAFAYSPLLEAVLSLHVLVAPKHHPLQHAWVRSARRLSPRVKRELRAFAFLYRQFVPDFCFPSPDTEFASFEEELDAFLALDPVLRAFDFLRPMWDHEGERDPAKLELPEARAAAVRNARRLGGDPELALLLFDDADELSRRFVSLLRAYWSEAFEREWQRLEPRLASTVEEAGEQIAAGSLYRLLETMPRRLRVDVEREEFGVDVPHDHTIEVDESRPVVLTPSFFAWPHVHVQCDEPWPLGLVYPAPFVAREAARPLPSSELLRVLRALADDTRLRALRLIAEHPRSTQELAPLVGISEAGLSKHLRQLAECGILETRRDGYYVLYSLRSDRIEPVSHALLAFLGGAARPPGDRGEWVF
jgi:DNA-binding transcriptional ArsR family regulator